MEKSFPDLPHTPTKTQIYDAVIVMSFVGSVTYPAGLEPLTCCVRIHYAIRLPTDASAVCVLYFWYKMF